MTKNVWAEQANPHDRNVTGANQIYKRFKHLFPKLSKQRETVNSENKGRFFLRGLDVSNFASLLHFSSTARDSASPLLHSASLLLHSPGEGEGEAVKEGSEAETQSLTAGEAVKQKDRVTALTEKNSEKFLENPPAQPPKLAPDKEALLAEILWWREALGWSPKRMKAFVNEEQDKRS